MGTGADGRLSRGPAGRRRAGPGVRRAGWGGGPLPPLLVAAATALAATAGNGPWMGAAQAGPQAHPGTSAGPPDPSELIAVPRRLVSVAAQPGRFLAWPANSGLWRWDGGREILVGYVDGPWVAKEGHQVGDPQEHRLARSLDGGLTWRSETPEPYVGREGRPLAVVEPIRFDAPDLAIRVVADGPEDPEHRLGRFFVSADRGRRWQGPFRFEGLDRDPQLRGLVLTSRTSTRVLGPSSAQFLLSARDPRLGRFNNRLDKTFVVQSDDGGRSWRVVSWVVPWSDPYRAVMPALVDLGQGRLVAALRRRDPRARPESPSWIDAYGSGDGGRSWRFLSRVDQTGVHNGNPPALALLPDGRLACVYANRSLRTMLLRLSGDGGLSWGPPVLIRSNPFQKDMGYPQLTVNHRGELVAIYYLATARRPQSFIEAALLRPPAAPPS